MLVPRSSKYSTSPDGAFEEKCGRRHLRKVAVPKTSEHKALSKTISSVQTETAQPNETNETSSKPVAVPTPGRSQAGRSHTMSMRSRRSHSGTRKAATGVHDPDALPPAVAALLAITAIPPRRSNRTRRKTVGQTQMSIDQLVQEWKSDDTSRNSYGSSPALSMLLEYSGHAEGQLAASADSSVEGVALHGRSISAESVPSLEADERSLLSFGSQLTPESLQSRRSTGNIKRDRPRSHASTEDSSFDHPLVPFPRGDDDDFTFSLHDNRSIKPKPRSSFTSNLTTSLKALKSAAINSISSLSLGNPTTPDLRSASPQFSDEMLWSHPFLFPRFSSEIRPDIQGTPTQAQRRYLNPAPPTFEEQEAPFQQALHAPFLAEHSHQMTGTAHEMQSYSLGKRKASQNRRPAADPQSEASRSLPAAAGVRQREPRENSDFLRVVVLEMNMRRQGKLETGRARMCLPPRQVSAVPDEMACKVPRRWRGESASY